MSETDALGRLADASLVGSTFEQGGHGGPGSGACANCGAAATGNYCQNCGQRSVVHRSALHLVEEFFHGLFHFDGKLWHTIPLLLVRPGALSRRYIEGQRVRFVSPIALFLFSIFLLFFAFATLDPLSKVYHPGLPTDARTAVKQNLDAAQSDLRDAQKDVEDAKQDDNANEKARTEEVLKQAQSAVEAAKRATEVAPSKSDQNSADNFNVDADDFDWRKTLKSLADSTKFKMVGGPKMEARARESLRDPDLLVYKLKSAASEYSFLLVPMSVPFLWVLFMFRRGVYLYDHVIFVLHSLSFMALFAALWAGAVKINLGTQLFIWPLLVPMVHQFIHLKGTYRLGIFGAVWRTMFLQIVAVTVLSIYVVVILVLGLLD